MFQKPFWLIDFNLLRYHAFAFKKKKSLIILRVHDLFLALLGRLQKKNKKQQQTPFAFHFHTFFTIFSCIVAFH